MTLTESSTTASSSGAPGRFSIVCLSPQEWDTPLPTNRQQIMGRAAARGHEVLFVETGDFLGKHLVRLIKGPNRREQLGRLLGAIEVLPGLRVAKAVNLLPWGQRYRFSSRVNGILSAGHVRRLARHMPGPRVVWLYDPRATWAIGGHVAVYDCVDDYAEQASGARNQALVSAADREAASKARLVFTTTEALRQRHLAVNDHTVVVRNVGDFAHFAPAASRDVARPDLAALPRPVLGFHGNVLSGKLDPALVEQLAERTEGTVVLAGPADDGLRTRIEQLATRPNVVWLGGVPYPELPSVVAAFDVGLIPYEANATRATSSL
jgi:glycosyltransferase involved in cell wall biosynthesis